MRLGIVAFFMLALALLLSANQAKAGALSELKDNIDEQCVINCLNDEANANECKRADVLACRETCTLPPPAILYIGGVAVNPDLEDPGKIAAIFAQALANLGLSNNKDIGTFITFSKDNPLQELGISIPSIGILTMLNLKFQPQELPELGNIVVTQGEIPCMASKTYTYPSGNHGVGCREIKKLGATGWAAQGCGAEAAATTDIYYGDWSTFCCNAVGRACPTCPLQAGYGVCSVNSTAGGDGAY